MKRIPLRNSSDFALVDDEDYELVSKYTWRVNGGYAFKIICLPKPSVKKQRGVYMHRLIMNPTGKLTVDHINLDKLNNQKENLRICEHRENMYNRPKRANAVDSQYKGVSRHKPTGKWQVNICKTENGIKKQHHFGYFSSEIEAALAYDKKAVELFGKFARLNFPDRSIAV